jgi:hypothetical protein
VSKDRGYQPSRHGVCEGGVIEKGRACVRTFREEPSAGPSVRSTHDKKIIRRKHSPEDSRDPALLASKRSGGVLVFWALICLGTDLDLANRRSSIFAGRACANRNRLVPIRSFLADDHPFGPEDIARMSAASGKLKVVLQ